MRIIVISFWLHDQIPPQQYESNWVHCSYFLPPMYVVCEKVILSVISFCLSVYKGSQIYTFGQVQVVGGPHVVGKQAGFLVKITFGYTITLATDKISFTKLLQNINATNQLKSVLFTISMSEESLRWLVNLISHQSHLTSIWPCVDLTCGKLDFTKIIFFTSDWTKDSKAQETHKISKVFRVLHIIRCSLVQSDHIWVESWLT